MKQGLFNYLREIKHKHQNLFFGLNVVLYIILSCSIYSFMVTSFVNSEGSNLLTGGASGLALVIARYIIPANTFNLSTNNWYSIIYIAINIPLLIIAYKHIGKLFSLITLSNVFLTSILISLIPPHFWDFLKVSEMEMITISLFAGVLSGLSIGFALKGNFSTGGTDILALAFSIKKGVNIGRYQIAFNFIVIVLGGFLSREWQAMLYTFIYILTSGLVVDFVHTKNRKTLLEVVSTKGEEISDILLKESHHGVTILKAVGAYTHEEKIMLQIVVSSYQISEVVAKIKKIDPLSFVMQVPVDRIYGRFYITPFK